MKITFHSDPQTDALRSIDFAEMRRHIKVAAIRGKRKGTGEGYADGEVFEVEAHIVVIDANTDEIMLVLPDGKSFDVRDDASSLPPHDEVV